VPDGYDRLGMVQEARGQLREAADSYRKVLEMVQSDPESYDPGYSDMFNDLIAKLDAPAADVDSIREPQFD
jgi:predicted TPR repeat methyltransferase